MTDAEDYEPEGAGRDRGGTFTTDVLTIVGGTTIAQILVVLASPILTRLYLPDDYGLMTLFTSITAIVTVVACLRYEVAIMLPERDGEAANLLALSMLLAVLVSVATGVALVLFEGPVLAYLNAPLLAPAIPFVPLFVLLSGWFLAMNYWNSRTRHFRRLSAARVTSSGTTVAAQLAAGFAGRATGGSLIGGMVLGSAVANGALAARIWKDHGALFRRSVSWAGMRAMLGRYRRFPLLDTSGALINTVSWQLPALLLAAFFTPAAAGLYGLGFRVLQLPMSLIGSSIAQVFFQRAAEARHDGTLAGVVEAVFRVLLKLSMLPMVLLALVGEEFFTLVFGAAWGEAGLYTQILSIWAIFWFVSSPLSSLFSVLEQQGLGLKLSIIVFATRLASLVAGGVMGSVVVALALFSATGVLVYGGASLVLLDLAGVSRRRSIGVFVRQAAAVLPAVFVLAAADLSGAPPLVLLFLAGVLFLLYAGYMAVRDPDITQLLRTIRGKVRGHRAE